MPRTNTHVKPGNSPYIKKYIDLGSGQWIKGDKGIGFVCGVSPIKIAWFNPDQPVNFAGITNHNDLNAEVVVLSDVEITYYLPHQPLNDEIPF